MLLIKPMMATPGILPSAKVDEQYAYEIKWDGVRAVAYLERGALRVLGRSDREITGTYPELAALTDAVGGDYVLDGEVVAIDKLGQASFSDLQRRMHVVRPSARLLDEVPVTYFVFDILAIGERLLLGESYEDRRALLFDLAIDDPVVQVPPHVFGGEQALSTSERVGAEGLIAKRLTSRYLPGRRSPEWIKIKHHLELEVIIGGWRPGAGNREGGIGSLLLGVPSPAGLRYVGHVGTGFTHAMLDDLARQLRPLATSVRPFVNPMPRDHARDAQWVTPNLVGEVRYSQWTPDGILRHPVWRGLRPDKSPADVTPDENAV